MQQGKKKGRIARSSSQYLDVRVYDSTAQCIQDLLHDGREIWATDLAEVGFGV